MTTQAIRHNPQQAKPIKQGWWLVARHELTDLWVGGRALILLILFSILLGVTSFLLASNAELKLLPPREMAFMIVQITIIVGLFVGMLISADSVSGERERATLEGLLLVPTSRRQIIVGKFLAALSPWPAVLALATVHLAVLMPNRTIFTEAFLLAAGLGTLLAIGFTGFGMLVSVWARSNRISLFVTLLVAVLFLLPTQFPGTAQTGFMGKLVKRINPMESVNQFVEKILVNNRTFDEMVSWLVAPVLLAVLMLVMLFVYAAPRLDLDGDRVRQFRPKSTRFTALTVALLLTFVVQSAHAQSAAGLAIAIDTDVIAAKTGDTFDFTTVVTNHGDTLTGDIVVAMNIINLGDGDPVDPEDWSPERTQSVDPLAAGESAEQKWIINTILEGDYLAYMVVVPAPDNSQTTSEPIASTGIHMTVGQFSPLNPSGILPVTLGMPLALSLVLSTQLWRRRRHVDSVAIA